MGKVQLEIGCLFNQSIFLSKQRIWVQTFGIKSIFQWDCMDSRVVHHIIMWVVCCTFLTHVWPIEPLFKNMAKVFV